jgi:integrase
VETSATSLTQGLDKEIRFPSICKVCAVSGISKARTYHFRTTYGTELCEAGLTSKQVGDLMGHADTRMLETVYARQSEEGVMKQLDFLNNLNSAYVN